MNREQLKTLINEAIKEVLNEKTPKGFNPKLKKQITAKKTKKLKEQNETEPFDPQASAEPDAGEMEGPDSEVSTAPMSALDEIDTIVSMLYSLRAKLSGDPEPDEEPEGEEETD
jgi:hypothetical protein